MIFFSFSILESFFRKPLVDKTGVVDGFTRVTEAPECQKYWWGQAYVVGIIYPLGIELIYLPKIESPCPKTVPAALFSTMWWMVGEKKE